MSESSTMTYRKDIDGLRAVAVLSVIAYHMSATWLPGGYLGVDIFFVLSGFLITSIIYEDVKRGQFSILRFYERRVRRIMPALLVMIVAVSIISSIILLPADLIGFGKSVFATLSFSANTYFWLDTNYFARAASEKPLLHIWSLGVEEQFYFLFPLIVSVTAKFKATAVLPVVVIFTAASFGVNFLLIKAGGANPAFFLAPARAWELGAGAVMALLPIGLLPYRWRAEVAAVVGAGLVAIVLRDYGAGYRQIPAALPAVIGTCLLIGAAANTSPFTNRILQWPPVVWVGKISYSLYLWHWPVLVFLRYYLVRDLTTLELILAFLLIVVLAIMSWHWIEKPFRGPTVNSRLLMRYTVGGTAVAAMIAALGLLTNGLPERLSADAALINASVGTNFRCAVTDYRAFGTSRACVLNLPSGDIKDTEVVLFGNSHAQMYAPLVEELAQAQNVPALLVPMNGCLPTVRFNVSANCIEMASNNLEALLNLPIVKLVVLGLNWPSSENKLVDARGKVAEDNSGAELIAALDDVIQTIKSSGRSVVLIGPLEIPGWDVASTLSRERAFGWPQSRADHDPVQSFNERHGDEIKHFSESLGANFLRPDKVQCDGTVCLFIIEGHSLFADSNHIAKAELFRFKQTFAPLSQAMQSAK